MKFPLNVFIYLFILYKYKTVYSSIQHSDLHPCFLYQYCQSALAGCFGKGHFRKQPVIINVYRVAHCRYHCFWCVLSQIIQGINYNNMRTMRVQKNGCDGCTNVGKDFAWETQYYYHKHLVLSRILSFDRERTAVYPGVVIIIIMIRCVYFS